MRRVLFFLFVFAFSVRPLLSAGELLIDPDQAPPHFGESVAKAVQNRNAHRSISPRAL
jgi:hypothetical protein